MKRMTPDGGFLGVMVLAMLLYGCATTPVDQKLYAVDAAVTQSMQLATQLRKDGLINDADWPKVKEGLKQASSQLDEAWASFKSDPEGAQKKLFSAQAIIAHLNTLLVAKLQ